MVLVGEIRDVETAETAIQASLTGHLVLSTLHTNDAPTAVTRLVDMGVEPYKLASALRGVVAQRLLRRLCPICKEEQKGTVTPRMKKFIPDGTRLFQAVGCPECATTGYRGRFSIVEVLTMTPEVKRMVGGGATASSISDHARRMGMGSLFDCGLRHVIDGETTVDELLRVTDIPMDDTAPGSPEPPPTQTLRPEPGRAVAPAAAAPPASAPAPVAAPAPGGPRAPAIDLGFSFDLLDEIDGAAAAGDNRPSRGRTILLVEDEDQLRRVMRDLLEREGYTVAEARDGVQALDAVDRHAPDLIMLDLNLPGLDGYGVLQQLRSRPQTAQIQIGRAHV